MFNIKAKRTDYKFVYLKKIVNKTLITHHKMSKNFDISLLYQPRFDKLLYYISTLTDNNFFMKVETVIVYKPLLQSHSKRQIGNW